MEGTKFCPVAKADCRKEQCAWWDKYINECAVLSIMLALWADVDEDDEAEEDKAEEDEEGEDGEKEREFKVKIRRLD
jgi:hypothetical protein